jgi:hypothetical protein
MRGYNNDAPFNCRVTGEPWYVTIFCTSWWYFVRGILHLRKEICALVCLQRSMQTCGEIRGWPTLEVMIGYSYVVIASLSFAILRHTIKEENKHRLTRLKLQLIWWTNTSFIAPSVCLQYLNLSLYAVEMYSLTSLPWSYDGILEILMTEILTANCYIHRLHIAT